MIKQLVVVIMALLVGTMALADQSIHVEWGYTPPTEPAVTSYRLYQNGQAVMTWPGAAITEGDATLAALALGDIFTLTALFADETESPHSAPYLWTGGPIKFVTFRATNHPGRTNKPGVVRLR